MKKKQFAEYIQRFDFQSLFNELGWDNFNNQLPIAVDDDAFMLSGIAEKRGFVILHCPALPSGKIPASNLRKQIDNKVAKHYFEHLIIYSDEAKNHQIWQLAIKEENKPKQVREVSWYNHQDVESLFQRLKNLLFTLDEEETITIVDVKQRISENFAKNTESVTKKFYTEFKKQHTAFLDFIQGIDDHIKNKENENKQWYASLMLNRLMFCYFIQKKGFLDQDLNYLQNKLNECRNLDGSKNFYSFYRSFLLELFHDGLGKPQERRKDEVPISLGKIPYLNGGLFDVHELELQFDQIEIEDDAFAKVFDFFDQWNWHLDNSIESTGKDINPDVIGYIFEKYINDRAAMGAYYTKEDITDYIGKNTIIPFLFDECQKKYNEGFKKGSKFWEFLKNNGEKYIYDVLKYGIPRGENEFSDLPEEVKAGIDHPLEDKMVSSKVSEHLWQIREPWNLKAPESIALPTELYREVINRRKHFVKLKNAVESGEIHSVDDLISLNLDIRQFTQDFIENVDDPDFIKAFYESIQKITVLDPTCGSGAFLFAALNILEPIYEACITRMEQYTSEYPSKYVFFENTLSEINSDKHPSLQYYIYKSIILNNLFGVDIMHEAVEIAKLRLFLKLVATVDVNPRKENFGLEPLPDIDFNIRSGNSLIGFATEKELFETIARKEPLFANDRLKEFKEGFELVSQAFMRFQDSQLINDQGSQEFKQAKSVLKDRLFNLNDSLNKYLATNYNVDPESQIDKYENWKNSHKPFNWFAEFYNIISKEGGFDCIIGNPPYVVYSEKKFPYTIQGYRSENCKDLYGYTIERSMLLSKDYGRNGMIVPISIVSTDGFSTLRELMIENSDRIYFSSYGMRPGKLFDGVDKHLTIFISKLGANPAQIFTSKYYRWNSEARKELMPQIQYTLVDKNVWHNGSIPKISTDIQNSILTKLKAKKSIEFELSGSGSHNGYHTRKLRYFVQFLDCAPKIYEEDGSLRVTSELKVLKFKSEQDKLIGLSAYLSSLFFWYYIGFSDCRNVNKREVHSFPISFSDMNSEVKKELAELGDQILLNLQENSTFQVATYKKYGTLKMQTFQPRKSKMVVNKIDTALAKYYGFSEIELDNIVNYDIKYRMGKELFGEEDEDED